MSSAIQRSFSGGEIAPGLYARADLARYQTGLRTLRNMIVAADGGAQNRTGSKLVATTKYVNGAYSQVRLIEWEFNTVDQNYVLELGETYMRFHQNGSPVLITAPAAWGGAVNYVIGDLVSYLGANFYAILANVNHLPVPGNADKWYPLEGNIYEIPTPWTYAELVDLQFTQQADVMTFVHKAHLPANLIRSGQTNWAITGVPVPDGTHYFPPVISSPANVVNSGVAGVGIVWFVTQVSSDGEESLPAFTGSSSVPSSVAPIGIFWDAVGAPFGYNVYRVDGTGTGFLGFTAGVTFYDYGTVSNTSIQPTNTRVEFNVGADTAAKSYPSVITSFQKRRYIANKYPFLSDIWGSRIGQETNFAVKLPTLADSSMRFRITGRRVGEIRHMIDIGFLVVFTTDGEVIVKGDFSGLLSPATENPTFYSYNGASKVRPLVYGSNSLYIQEVGSIVRDLGFDPLRGGRDGYLDSDLTAMARHLISGFTITDWALQKFPFPIVWARRSDGNMLGLTYDKGQQVQAWHHHDTLGTYENVACVKEGLEHAVYKVVKRTIAGESVRFIERDASRLYTDIRDAVFMDCALNYDGRNTDATHTMLLQNGGTWLANADTVLISSADYFTDDDIDNTVIQMTGTSAPDDAGFTTTVTVNCAIVGYTDAKHVTVRPEKDIPEYLQAELITTWAKAISVITGVDHLEDRAVSILADGFVVSSPNNAQYPTIVVEGGSVTLPNCYGVVQIGLPYISDLETLDLETMNAETLAAKYMLVSECTVFVEGSRGMYAGGQLPTGSDQLENLSELKPEGVNYAGPVPLRTGKARLKIKSEWTNNGRVGLRQVDPLPLKVNAIVPTGFLGG